MPEKAPVSLILHDIRSAQNVGAIFRTADAAGVFKIYITGYTPAPLDRFAREQAMIKKTALGAERSVLWQTHPDIFVLLDELQASRTQIVALEQHQQAIDYKMFSLQGPTAIIFGREVEGIAPEILLRCDTICSIPMYGAKESLNVSVAAGIFLFRALDR